MLSKIVSSGTIGIDAYLVDVEVDISLGLPAYIMAGLPDTAIKESRGRIEAAIKNCGIEFPFDRITINLAPADRKKEGASFDLPLAVGILNASGIIKNDRLSEYIIMGELSLDGMIKPVKGALSIASFAKNIKSVKGIILPKENAKEASFIEGIYIYPANSLSEVIEFLNGKISITPEKRDPSKILRSTINYDFDFSDVSGQYHVKRALEVAASGGHNVLMIGPPGSGKSMLAKRIQTILPDLSVSEAIETTKIHSIAGLLPDNFNLACKRPFRSPHHTISDAGLIGGGQYPTPGEVSLSHNGVLFLDELAEFKRHVLEVMRQPLEDGEVTISRASMTVSFPSNFMFVSATNPCPCGYLNHNTRACSCSFSQIKKYMSKISGPLLDRIDIHIDVPAVEYHELSKNIVGESSKNIKQRVEAARKIQQQRFNDNSKIYSNSEMTSKQLKKYCKVCSESKEILISAIDKMGFSTRALDRMLKLSRTIADLENEKNILPKHLLEAIQYRSLDRNI